MHSDILEKIINNLRTNPRDLHTVPSGNREPLWFYAESDGKVIRVYKAKNHVPSSKIEDIGRVIDMGASENMDIQCEKLYDLYKKKIAGKSVNDDAKQLTFAWSYWQALFDQCVE